MAQLVMVRKIIPLIIMPAARAIATKCMVRFVEPPVANSTIIPLTHQSPFRQLIDQ